jgi:hypothetical protein
VLWAGHIGLGIRPSARRRGLATWALGRMLDEARVLGLDRVLAACAVPIPAFLVEELGEQVRGKDRNELVFTGVKGDPLRAQAFQRAALSDAARAIGIDRLHPHEPRHTAASLAIASGADEVAPWPGTPRRVAADVSPM